MAVAMYSITWETVMLTSNFVKCVLGASFIVAGVLTLYVPARAQTITGPCDNCASLICSDGYEPGCVPVGDTCVCQCVNTCDPNSSCATIVP